MQEKLPPKKIYTATEKGITELKEWTQSEPGLPKIHHSFLIQLAWADLLSDDELTEVCNKYKLIVEEQLKKLKSPLQKEITAMGRTKREKRVWEMILKNGILFYENELKWIEELISNQ
jgi:DNA-binding PadR family transcriptional regulator